MFYIVLHKLKMLLSYSCDNQGMNIYRVSGKFNFVKM